MDNSAGRFCKVTSRFFLSHNAVCTYSYQLNKRIQPISNKDCGEIFDVCVKVGNVLTLIHYGHYDLIEQVEGYVISVERVLGKMCFQEVAVRILDVAQFKNGLDCLPYT